jgi:phosphoserine phosphatase
MTILYLVRHAETASNADGRTQGHRDEALTERGRAQATAIGEMLRPWRLAAVHSSDSSRAVDTAVAIAGVQGLQVVRDARLREMHQGDLDGLTSAELRRDHAPFLERWRGGDPADLRMPGGETLREVQARIVAAVEEIAAAHHEATAAVVSHNLALKALLCHGLLLPLSSFRRIRVDVGSLTELEVRPGEPWVVNRLNEACHLSS